MPHRIHMYTKHLCYYGYYAKKEACTDHDISYTALAIDLTTSVVLVNYNQN